MSGSRTPSDVVLAMPKLYVPLPVTNGFTSNSIQVLAGTSPLSSIGVLVRAGRLFQLTVVSPQLVAVVKTAGPSTVPVYAKIRSLAERTVPAATPVTVNRR